MEFLADLHSEVIHFPIAFLVVYPIMEIIAVSTKNDFFTKSALLFLIIGVLGALSAVLTGNQAFIVSPEMQNETLEIFDQHIIYANITLWLFAALLLFRIYITIRKKLSLKFHLMVVIIAFIGMYFIYQTGSYGGKLAQNKIFDSVQEFSNSNKE